MSFPEAFKGAKVELSTCHSNAERVSKLFHIARVLVAEGIGALSMVPYGYRAFQLYRALPSSGSSLQNNWLSATVAKDVRYSSQPRTVMDIYVPHAPHEPLDGSSQPQSRSSPAQGCVQPGTGFPVALFCHGGVWATGEKWHYAPMATRLAQCGILTCVVSYTLYPQAKARDMVAELSQALSWTLDNIQGYGGNPDQVSALGHSAGAHMWAMVLLERARAARRRASQGSSDDSRAAAGQLDSRMPARLVGMAGVYDISQHLKYEAGRGVRYLSTMERALGGEAEFASQSPSVILASAAGRGRKVGAEDSAAAGRRAERAGGRVAEDAGFAGSGIAIAPSAAAAAPAVNLQGDSGLQALQQQSCATPENLDFYMEDARRLPPWHLYSSKADLTVPWIQSCLMEQALQACHVSVQHEYFEETCVSHASFVTAWKPLLADQRSVPERHSGSTSDRPVPPISGEGLRYKQGLPAYLEAVVSNLQGIKRKS